MTRLSATIVAITLGLLVLLAQEVTFGRQEAGQLARLQDVTFTGEAVRGVENLSAVLVSGEQLVVADDELRGVLVGRRTAPDSYAFGPELPLDIKPAGDNPSREFDFEALSLNGAAIVAVGSHSARRVNVNGDNDRKRPQAENRRRQLDTYQEPSRDVLVQFELDSSTGVISGRPTLSSLRTLIKSDPILNAFATTPGKENGVDIEGFAIEGQTMWVGFRGPVLRNAYAIVLRATNVAAPAAESLIFLPLGGRGIRDLVRVAGGFLVLAGPVGDGDQSEAVYWWNGEDCITGTPSKCDVKNDLRMLGQVARVSHASKTGDTLVGKAEGLAVVTTNDTAFDVLVVFDGVPGGAPGIYRVPKL